MPGTAYITMMEPDHALRLAHEVATNMDFTVQRCADWQLEVRRGSLVASIFVGAFVAYCDFRLTVVMPGDGTTHLVLERNSPWWTGFIGVSRVKRAAQELADALGNAIHGAGGQILSRQEF